MHAKRRTVGREYVAPLKRKLALCNAGKWFAKSQLQNGMSHFKT